ncbi:MAG: TrbC/VirB2 family protein [Proteobacteria bacterium]|nr:TrbC/VirB2 family protein [Pseudomonadota bacterium]
MPSFVSSRSAIAARCFLPRLALIAASFALFSVEAFAQGTLQPVQSTLQTLVQALTGPIATSLAILAVIACGFLAWSGRLTWGIAGSVIFGIVLVFGSAQIVQFFQSAVGR